jgi:hypothetical protein
MCFVFLVILQKCPPGGVQIGLQLSDTPEAHTVRAQIFDEINLIRDVQVCDVQWLNPSNSFSANAHLTKCNSIPPFFWFIKLLRGLTLPSWSYLDRGFFVQ